MFGDSLYGPFILATVIMLLIPGPSIALIVASSISYGTRYGLLTVAGTLLAVFVQLTIIGMGLISLLDHLTPWFTLLRWLAIGYLLYLGMKQWFGGAAQLDGANLGSGAVRGILLRAFVISLFNPKTLFFYIIFFPQFILPGPGVSGEIVRNCCTLFCLAAVLDSLWAFLGGYVRNFLVSREMLAQRFTGGLLMAASAALALVTLLPKK